MDANGGWQSQVTSRSIYSPHSSHRKSSCFYRRRLLHTLLTPRTLIRSAQYLTFSYWDKFDIFSAHARHIPSLFLLYFSKCFTNNLMIYLKCSSFQLIYLTSFREFVLEIEFVFCFIEDVENEEWWKWLKSAYKKYFCKLSTSRHAYF